MVLCCKKLSIVNILVYFFHNTPRYLHTDNVYRKLSRFVRIFYKLQHKLPNTVLRNIYFAFIYPHLIYGIELYCNTFHTYLDKLLKLNNELQILQGQNKCRYVKELYIHYNTLPVLQLHEFHVNYYLCKSVCIIK